MCSTKFGIVLRQYNEIDYVHRNPLDELAFYQPSQRNDADGELLHDAVIYVANSGLKDHVVKCDRSSAIVSVNLQRSDF